MSESRLDQNLKSAITISESIFSNEQTFTTLRAVDTWVSGTISQISVYLNNIKRYFKDGQVDALVSPFEQIQEILSSFDDEEPIKINTAAKQIQKLLDNTLADGLTFAHPSSLNTAYRKNGNVQYTVALLKEAFGLTWVGTEDEIYAFASNPNFHSGMNYVKFLMAQQKSVAPDAGAASYQLKLAGQIANWVSVVI